LGCVDKIKLYFNIEKWQINQPIILADVASELLGVEGVATVVKPLESSTELISVTNKWGTMNGLNYSQNIYQIEQEASIFNSVVYPPIDPTIFEIKHPDSDIRGRVMGDI